MTVETESGKMNVNARLYWDAGHGADEDAEDFIAWIGAITGFTSRRQQEP
jgi:hypothetical protein